METRWEWKPCLHTESEKQQWRRHAGKSKERGSAHGKYPNKRKILPAYIVLVSVTTVSK